jgi:hypothetical protein
MDLDIFLRELLPYEAEASLMELAQNLLPNFWQHLLFQESVHAIGRDCG